LWIDFRFRAYVREELEINKDDEYIFLIDNIIIKDSHLNDALEIIRPGEDYNIDYLYDKLIVTEVITKKRIRKRIPLPLRAISIENPNF